MSENRRALLLPLPKAAIPGRREWPQCTGLQVLSVVIAGQPQVASGAVEVKTTTAKQPQSVRITSERQLDQAGIPWLFLHVVVLDEREVEGVHDSVGESLPGIVAALRKQLQATAAAAESRMPAVSGVANQQTNSRFCECATHRRLCFFQFIVSHPLKM